MISKPPLNFGVEKNQWLYLFIFFATNCVISFSDFSGATKLTLGLFGLVLPLYVALRVSAPVPSRSLASYSKEMKDQPTQALWLILFFFMVFLRFFKLTTFSCWPNLDEGWIGTIALDLSQHWHWKFLWWETPPLTLWIVTGFFKLGCSPAFSLWFTSALASTLTVPLAYLAARQYFSKSFSFICGCLFAFSTWPLFIGKFCHQGIWLPLWVCLCLFLLGRFLKSNSKNQPRAIVVLGLGVGLGSFTFTSWPVVAIVFGATVFWKTTRIAPRKPHLFFYFLAAFLLTLFPFLLAVFNDGFGQHILSLSPSSRFFHWNNFIPNFIHYLTTLVWSSFEPAPAYAPVEGGFLNPLLGAFFFIGLVEMWRLRYHRLIQWVALSFGLFLLPGILSMNLETFRMAQVLPLLLLIAALGTHSFLISRPKRWLSLFLLLLVPSTAFDFLILSAPYVNLEKHPQDFGRPLKSMEKYRAYQLLDKIQKQLGPGFVLTDFDTDSFSEATLSVMAYPFNAARNSQIEGADCHWVGIFVNIHYLPFLKKRFPEGLWFPLSDVTEDIRKKQLEILPLTPVENMLGFLPLTAQNQKQLIPWIQAHAIFQEADLKKLSMNTDLAVLPAKILRTAYPLVKNDPFLQSCYWDKMAAYAFRSRSYEGHQQALEEAVSKGYPTADLYYKLAVVLLVKDQKDRARVYLRKATQSPLDLTPARFLLGQLNPGAKP
ncbi:MAG TPA: glycosyltransferase family 39 protein [bacterium]